MRELNTLLQEKLSKSHKTAFLGVGSVLRSDDGVGMYLIEQLSTQLKKDQFLLLAGSTAPENFTGVIKDFAPDLLLVIDAAELGLPVGEIRLIDPEEIEGLTFSTHMLPLSFMFQYLSMEIDCEILCIGIQPQSTEQGFIVCEEVKKAAEHLSKILCDALR
ncbi:MAG TPA: hydrogenase maturation peptidase HycI [Bacillota bacterium]|nr:hydrogenase maturation peptidase HycI [Bacillota bacterium]